MKSLKRSSRRDRSWASWPARAWLRRLSQVVRPDVSPPTIDPASADNAGRYAASYIYDYMNFVTVITLTPKCHSSHLPYVCPLFCEVADSTLFKGSVSGVGRGSTLRNRVLFLEAGLQILQVYCNAGLCAFLGSSQLLDRPQK